MLRVAMAGLAILIAGGCGGTTWINKKYRQRIDPSSERVLLMPVVAHRFPVSMRGPVEKQVFAEVSQSFANVSVSVFPLKAKLEPAGFGNLSWHIAQAVYHQGRHKKSPDIRGEYYDWSQDLPGLATKFLAWVKGALAEAGGAGSSKASYRYILAMYVEFLQRLDDEKHGKRIAFRVVGGIYDAQESRIVAATWVEITCAPTMKAVQDRLTGIGGRLRKALRPVLP